MAAAAAVAVAAAAAAAAAAVAVAVAVGWLWLGGRSQRSQHGGPALLKLKSETDEVDEVVRLGRAELGHNVSLHNKV